MNSGHNTIVFDTSTIIGAVLFPESPPARAFYHAAINHQLVASGETLNELREVLCREKFNQWRTEAERTKFLALYLDVVGIVVVTSQVQDCRDPKDNKFLSLACSAEADCIVTSDDDLLVLHPYRGIQIVTVRQYLEIMKNRADGIL
ncbi:MAG: putative toxin-antitoxin system toxin component, PIN family [Candidatus Methylumidiphilus sp.]